MPLVDPLPLPCTGHKLTNDYIGQISELCEVVYDIKILNIYTQIKFNYIDVYCTIYLQKHVIYTNIQFD